MSPGKAAAQFGHAFKLSTYNTLKTKPDLFETYLGNSIGTNVCLVAPSLDHLERILWDVQNLPHVWIEDSGHIYPPHFDGSPLATCIGLGPIQREDLPRSVKRLPIYKGEIQ